MEIVPPDVIEIRDANIDTSVIECREETSDDDVEENKDRVRLVAEELVRHVADDEEGPEVVVLA